MIVNEALQLLRLIVEATCYYDKYDNREAHHPEKYVKVPQVVVFDEPIGYGGIPIIHVFHFYHVH